MAEMTVGGKVFSYMVGTVQGVTESMFDLLMDGWTGSIARSIVALYIVGVGYMLLKGRVGEKPKEWLTSIILVGVIYVGLLETSIYIDWILMNESEKKAKYYYVSNLRTQRLWALRLKAGTPEREVFSRTFQYLEKHLKATSLENIEEQAEEALSKIDSLLTRNGWKEINLEFDERKDRKTGAERYWYRMLGITSIRQLAEQVGRLGEYDLFYSRSSEVMHATSYRDHIQFDKGIVFFEPIRQLKDMHNLLRFITSVALSTYMSVLKHYRRGELSHFTRKYVRDWRGAFLNIPTVSYTHRTNGT